jgi:hypothetical protein
MIRRRAPALAATLGAMLVALGGADSPAVTAAGTLQPPDQFIGFRVGADNRLARWDTIVDYMKLAAGNSDRVRVRELGRTNADNPLIVVEISAPDTLKNLDRYKQLERKLYFQGGAPTDRERDEIFRSGKAVVLITCSVHAVEVGPTQMTLELVHRLATDDSPLVKKILDNVIFLLVPSANPDGQILVTDWFRSNLGTPSEGSPLPYLYHPYAGHDLNRDMYMFTQKESQYMARLVWHDWLPSVWLDQHQMGSNGARIFVMPAADPINPNVHPVIYRWNGIFGQSQAAALEAAGKHGIIYNSTYTNFWQGPMAWSGWWHNQIGLLTEVASVRIAAPLEQLRATPGIASLPPPPPTRSDPPLMPIGSAPLLPPTDITPRTEYPRPWMGGRWTLRDIVDYELITTMALLETAADRRETILRQIYEVNRQTIEEGRRGTGVAAIVIPAENQHDPREAAHLVERLEMAGVEVFQADEPFDGDGHTYSAGTYVVPMTQVFARYAKDILERQSYPEVRRTLDGPAELPYDVTAWSLGMLLGVQVDFLTTPIPSSLKLNAVNGRPRTPAGVTGSGSRYVFDYAGADTAVAINRLLKQGAEVSFEAASQVAAAGVSRDQMEAIARDTGLVARAAEAPRADAAAEQPQAFGIRAPKIAVYAPWTGGNIDEGWTRWVLEQYGFTVTTVHNADMRAGLLRQRFDAIILPDQNIRDLVDGYNAPSIKPQYRGGIGEAGVENLEQFVGDGGTLIALGAASDLLIDRLAIPVRNIKRGLRREQHSAPGTILSVQVDTAHPLGYGMAAQTYGFYTNSPFFAVQGFDLQRATVVARYPNTNVVASGWLRGEELMAGRAAVVSVEMNPGRVVLFGLRPQHRAQTHATFPMLFNALYLAAATGRATTTQ